MSLDTFLSKAEQLYESDRVQRPTFSENHNPRPGWTGLSVIIQKYWIDKAKEENIDLNLH